MNQRNGQYTTEDKVKLVLQILEGRSISSLAREVGLPRQQLSAWRQRFLAGGQAYLKDRRDLEHLQAENVALTRRLKQLEPSGAVRTPTPPPAHCADEPDATYMHPYCSAAYATAQLESGMQILAVPAWGSHVLIRQGPKGRLMAVGGRPFTSLDPNSDIEAGLDHLRREGVRSVSLVSDPMWSPDHATLEQGFQVCRRFKETYFVDREAGCAPITKRHRNRVSQARRRGGELREISFADHLDVWSDLYGHNVANRQIAQPLSSTYFERLADFDELRTFAVVVDSEIATITTWIKYGDVLYFHDAASSAAGHEAAASYIAFAHVVEALDDCRFVFLGGAAEFFDDPLDGLARFKRGFSNGSAVSYLCSTIL
jgi:transposase-like protein